MNTIGDGHCGQISVPGGSSLRNFVLFSTRLHSNKHTQKPESSFLELSDFFYRDTYRASRDTLLAPSLSRWLPRNYIHKLDFLLGKDYQVFRKINIINIILRRTKLPAVVFSKSHQKSIFLLYVFHSLISARHSLSLSWIILTVSLLCWWL